MTRKKLHRTLLVLLLVLTPPYFLMFTDEGQRIADNAVLWVMGGDSIELNIHQLNTDFTRADILKVFPDLPWQCATKKSAFGDQLCVAEISAYNDYPARYVSMFFIQDRVSAMKVVYRRPYHQQLQAHLVDQLGPPPATTDQPVVEWQAPAGKVVMPRTLQQDTEPAFLWIAG